MDKQDHHGKDRDQVAADLLEINSDQKTSNEIDLFTNLQNDFESLLNKRAKQQHLDTSLNELDKQLHAATHSANASGTIQPVQIDAQQQHEFGLKNRASSNAPYTGAVENPVSPQSGKHGSRRMLAASVITIALSISGVMYWFATQPDQQGIQTGQNGNHATHITRHASQPIQSNTLTASTSLGGMHATTEKKLTATNTDVAEKARQDARAAKAEKKQLADAAAASEEKRKEKQLAKASKEQHSANARSISEKKHPLNTHAMIHQQVVIKYGVLAAGVFGPLRS